MKYSWKYKKLDGITYNILPRKLIDPYIHEFIKNEWETDHREFPDQPWTIEWLNDLSVLKFRLKKIRLDTIIPRKDLMEYCTPADNFMESLQSRAEERELSCLRGISFEPLLINGIRNELMDGYTRYTVLKKNNHHLVYVYAGE